MLVIELVKCYYKAIYKVQVNVSSTNMLTGKEKVQTLLRYVIQAYRVTAEYER